MTSRLSPETGISTNLVQHLDVQRPGRPDQSGVRGNHGGERADRGFGGHGNLLLWKGRAILRVAYPQIEAWGFVSWRGSLVRRGCMAYHVYRVRNHERRESVIVICAQPLDVAEELGPELWWEPNDHKADHHEEVDDWASAYIALVVLWSKEDPSWVREKGEVFVGGNGAKTFHRILDW